MVFVGIISCKKEPLPELPEENEPYYSLKGNIDDEFIHLNVGQEGIKFSKGVSDLNGIKTYYGQIVSPAEDLVLKIEFTVPEKPHTATGISPFKSNGVEFVVHQEGCKKFNFGSSIIQNNYVQVMGDDGSFVQTDQVEFEEFGIHPIEVKFTNISQSSYELPINYGFQNASLNAGFTLQASADTTTFIAYNSTDNHKWWIDGNEVSSEDQFNQVISIGVHKVRHQITDAYGNTSDAYKLFRINDFVLDWNMGVVSCTGSNTQENNYGKVMVTVTKDGQIYSSDLAQSNLNEIFSVSNLEFVGNSSEDPDWVVFDFKFESVLMNDNHTDSLSLTEMEGTFNVGLK